LALAKNRSVTAKQFVEDQNRGAWPDPSISRDYGNFSGEGNTHSWDHHTKRKKSNAKLKIPTSNFQRIQRMRCKRRGRRKCIRLTSCRQKGALMKFYDAGQPDSGASQTSTTPIVHALSLTERKEKSFDDLDFIFNNTKRSVNG
jgi:hypothetical protein